MALGDSEEPLVEPDALSASAARRKRQRQYEEGLREEIRRLRGGIAGTATELEKRDASLARDVAHGLRSLLAVKCEHLTFSAPKRKPELARCIECGKDPDEAGLVGERIHIIYR